MGKSDPTNSNPHSQQSIVIVPVDTPGVNIIRPMKVFGYDDAPEGHCEIIYENVRVPLSNLVAGWGRGFEVCDILVMDISACNNTMIAIDYPRTTWVSMVLCQCNISSMLNQYCSPGRIHHCMRSIGAAQMALDLMIQRVTDPSRKTFGKYLYEHGKLTFGNEMYGQYINSYLIGTVVADIAKSRAEIEGARLLVLSAALQVRCSFILLNI